MGFRRARAAAAKASGTTAGVRRDILGRRVVLEELAGEEIAGGVSDTELAGVELTGGSSGGGSMMTTTTGLIRP